MYLPAPVYEALRKIAFDERLKIHDVVLEGIDRGQTTLFPEGLEDWIDADNPIRAIDAFDNLDLSGLGFDGVAPEATGRHSYHPSRLLKLYIFDYLNRVQSSRRLEREAGRNVEVMWLTCRLIPDHKTLDRWPIILAKVRNGDEHYGRPAAGACDPGIVKVRN